MNLYYARDGKPMSYEEWRKAYGDSAARIVEQTTLPDGKWISTVWLGVDHSFNDNSLPLIFETMVFPKQGEWGELDCERYSTLEEAQAGHKAMVEKWSKTDEAE